MAWEHRGNFYQLKIGKEYVGAVQDRVDDAKKRFRFAAEYDGDVVTRAEYFPTLEQAKAWVETLAKGGKAKDYSDRRARLHRALDCALDRAGASEGRFR